METSSRDTLDTSPCDTLDTGLSSEALDLSGYEFTAVVGDFGLATRIPTPESRRQKKLSKSASKVSFRKLLGIYLRSWAISSCPRR